jgi:CheY-like chemotaxis protein
VQQALQFFPVQARISPVKPVKKPAQTQWPRNRRNNCAMSVNAPDFILPDDGMADTETSVSSRLQHSWPAHNSQHRQGLERSYAPTNPAELADDDPTLPASLDALVDTGSYLYESPPPPEQTLERVIALPVNNINYPTGGPRSKRVLMVDDDLAARLYMRAKLMLRGNVEVMEASSGAQALDVMQSQHFDAVLLDVNMQQQNGYEVCRAIRKLVREQGILQPKIYMITSRTSALDKMRAKMAGADTFLSKPPHPAQLAMLLAEL